MPKAMNKKSREDLTNDIMEEINTSVKPEIVNNIVSDIKKEVNGEYKDQIKKEVTEDIKNDIKKELTKDIKKISRRKSWKIFRLYIYLFAVIACAIFLIYRLYQTDNLTIINERLTLKATNNVNNPVETTTTAVVKDVDYYFENYCELLSNIKIYDVSLIKKSPKVEDLSASEKLSMAYALLDDTNPDAIMVDGSIYTIFEEDIKNAYSQVFGDLETYEANSFSVMGLNFVYSNANTSYMAIGTKNDNQSYVNSMIINAYEENDELVFVTKAYVIKNNNVYSIGNLNYKLMEASEDMDLDKIKNRLSEVTYRFKKVDNKYSLSSIEKK